MTIYFVLCLFFTIFAAKYPLTLKTINMMKELLLKGRQRSRMLLALLLLAVVAFAVPAKRGQTRLLTLSNGTTVTATLVGDEHGHFWKGTDGKSYQMVAGSDFYQEVNSKEIINKAKQRRAKANDRRVRRLAPRRIGETGSITGQKKGLIILVNFKDVKFNNANNKTLKWKSEDPEVASVDENGIVTALKTGYTSIECRHGALWAIFKIEVAPFGYGIYVKNELGWEKTLLVARIIDKANFTPAGGLEPEGERDGYLFFKLDDSMMDQELIYSFTDGKGNSTGEFRKADYSKRIIYTTLSE